MVAVGDSAVCVQRWNGSPLMNGAGLPGMPIVSSTLPSKVQCRTVWSPSSVSQIVSSGATWTPCGRVNTPSPQVRNKLPSLSNTATGCSPRLKA